MLVEMIPDCPRLHHGIMAVDPEAVYGVEFVCRLCGTRIYPNKPELIDEAKAGVDHELGRSFGSCVNCGSPSDTHLLCRTCRRKDR